jgi:hypothetical protein
MYKPCHPASRIGRIGPYFTEKSRPLAGSSIRFVRCFGAPMRFRLIVALALIVCFLLPSAARQTTSSTPAVAPPVLRDPQAVAVLQTSIAALGGGTQPIPPSITAVGTYTDFAGASYQVRLMTLGIDKVRWETDLPNGTVVSIIRGRGGWKQDVDGTSMLSVADTVGQGNENLPLLALVKWATSPNVLVSLVGTESSAGVSQYHVSLTEGRDPTAPTDAEKILRAVRLCELYIDQQTNLPARLRYYEHPGDWRRSVPVDLVFSDYRTVAGLLFPFTLTRYSAGQKVNLIQLTSVGSAGRLSDDLFWVNQP